MRLLSCYNNQILLQLGRCTLSFGCRYWLCWQLCASVIKMQICSVMPNLHLQFSGLHFTFSFTTRFTMSFPLVKTYSFFSFFFVNLWRFCRKHCSQKWFLFQQFLWRIFYFFLSRLCNNNMQWQFRYADIQPRVLIVTALNNQVSIPYPSSSHTHPLKRAFFCSIPLITTKFLPYPSPTPDAPPPP